MNMLNTVFKSIHQRIMLTLGLLIFASWSICQCQEAVRVIWLDEFEEEMGHPDELASSGGKILCWMLRGECTELLERKNLNLVVIAAVTSQHKLGERASPLLDKVMRIKKVSAKDIDCVISTTYSRIGNRYQITSQISKARKKPDGTIEEFLPVGPALTDKFEPRTTPGGGFEFPNNVMEPLAHQLAVALHRHYDDAFVARTFAIYARQVKGVTPFLDQEGRTDYSNQLLRKLIAKLRDHGIEEVKKSSSETSADALLEVVIESDPVNKSLCDITAEITLKKDGTDAAVVQCTFDLSIQGSYRNAVDEMVEKLADRIRSHLERIAVSH